MAPEGFFERSRAEGIQAKLLRATLPMLSELDARQGSSNHTSSTRKLIGTVDANHHTSVRLAMPGLVRLTMRNGRNCAQLEASLL